MGKKKKKKNRNCSLKFSIENCWNFFLPFFFQSKCTGTGKTTTLQEIILQILTLFKHSKILIATQSNSAANLITQRLVESKQVNTSNLLRLISYRYSCRENVILDDIVDYCKIIDDLQGDKKLNYFQRLEQVKQFRIVISTSCTFAQLIAMTSLRNHFTHAVIDEAGQCTEVGLFALVWRKNGPKIFPLKKV